MSQSGSKRRCQSSVPHPRSSPSPMPLMSISSISSSSTSMATQSQMDRGNTSTSAPAKSVPFQQQKRGMTKKTTTKWLCSCCQSDVRLPPSVNANSRGGAVEKAASNCIDNVFSQMKCVTDAEIEVLKSTIVECSSLNCSSPKFHLSCLSIPIGSQVFRHTLLPSEGISTQPPSHQSQSSVDLGIDGNRCVSESQCLDAKEQLFTKSKRLVRNFFPFCNGEKDRDTRGTSVFKSKRKKDPMLSFSFLCPNCDVEGSSRYLLEYFEEFQSTKQSFYCNYFKECGIEIEKIKRMESVDECVEARTGMAFLHFLTTHHKADSSFERGTENPADLNKSEICVRHMEMVLKIIRKNQQIIHFDDKGCGSSNDCKVNSDNLVMNKLEPSYLVGRPLRLFNPIDRSYHTGRIIDFRMNAPYKVDHEILTRSHGRRKKRDRERSYRPHMLQLVDENICKTLYLVRFRDGMEGRKVAVHKWIYLEEHPCLIGGEVCWAKIVDSIGNEGIGVENFPNSEIMKSPVSDVSQHEESDSSKSVGDRNFLSIYRPVQMVYRSALEMIPVNCLDQKEETVQSYSRNLDCSVRAKGSNESIVESDNATVLAMGFGQTFHHISLSLRESIIDSHVSQKEAKNDATTKCVNDKNCDFAEKSKTTIAQDEKEEKILPPCRPSFFPFEPCIPDWLENILHRARLDDYDLALATAMAFMEIEEVKRVRKWKKLQSSYIIDVETFELA
mmetsp:Transcript_18355/g.37617  ORF Transcript_18355/g.37617 Transcript_18355/m.37617 type:complete len:726 (-) Transcript_18355:86-2263(-)